MVYKIRVKTRESGGGKKRSSFFLLCNGLEMRTWIAAASFLTIRECHPISQLKTQPPSYAKWISRLEWTPIYLLYKTSSLHLVIYYRRRYDIDRYKVNTRVFCVVLWNFRADCFYYGIRWVLSMIRNTKNVCTETNCAETC